LLFVILVRRIFTGSNGRITEKIQRTDEVSILGKLNAICISCSLLTQDIHRTPPPNKKPCVFVNPNDTD
jgi:hypothetical protein